MANAEVRIDILLEASRAKRGAQEVKQGIEDIKRADAGLNWDGVSEGEKAAKKADSGFTVLKGTIAAFAGNVLSRAVDSCKDLAVQAVDIGMGFETSMSKVSALSGATGDELGKLEAKARELGSSTTYSASEAADALGYMALAGWDTAEMLDGVGSVLTLAQAGEMELAAASDLVTDYLSAFNMEASETSRMVDVLAWAQANANTTVEGLGMAFKNCAANCNAAGLDVETTSAAISMMANQGLKGSEAGTALTAVMRDMTAKMEEGAIAIGDTNVAVMDSEGNYRDFADILADVEGATNGLGEAERASALQATFTADSIKGLNLLLNAGSDELAGFRDELYASAGAGQAMADTMTDNLGGDLAAMNSAFEELALKVYESVQEPLRDSVKFITSTVVPGLESLVKNADKVAPALIGIASGFAVIKNKAKLLSAAEKAQKALGSAVSFLTAETKGAEAAAKAQGAAVSGAAAKVRASTVAMNAGRAAAMGMGAALKAIAPLAAMTLLVEVVSMIGSSMAEAKEREDNLAQATEGLAEASSAYGAAASEAFGESAGAASECAATVEDVAAANRECLEKQADLARSMEETWKEAGAGAGMVDRYTDTIERLTSKVDANGEQAQLTAREQAELKAAVEGLNGATESNYEITDLATGQLSVSTDVIKKNSKAWKDNAKAQAAQAALEGVYQQQMEVKRQLEETNRALAESEEGFGLWLGDFPVLADEASVAYHELTQQRADLEAQSAALAESEEYCLSQIEGVTAAAPAAAEAADTLGISMEGAAASADGAAASTASLVELSEDYLKKVQEAVDGSPALQAAMGANGWSVELLGAKLQNAGIDAGDLVSSIEELSSKTCNEFEKIEYASGLSLDAMLETLTYNTEATRNWSDNVAALYESAGSDAERNYIAHIAEMGVEYAPIVQQLLDDSSGKLGELSAQWEEASATARDATISNAGLTSDGIVQTFAEDRPAVEAAAGETGAAIPSGMAQGMEGGAEEVTGAAASMANLAADKIREIFGIHSPSRVTHEMGLQVDAGLEGGVSDGSAGPVDAVGAMVSDMVDKMGGLDAAEGTAAGVFGSISSAVSEKMGTAEGSVTGAVDRMRSAFDFSWSLPKLKLPHLKVSGGFSISPPSVPSFGIDWYARGGVFSKAQVIGVGEAGAEAVLPLTNSRAMAAVGASIAEASAKGAPSCDTGITIVIEKFVHSGAEEDDEELLRRIAQKVKTRKRAGGLA